MIVILLLARFPAALLLVYAMLFALMSMLRDFVAYHFFRRLMPDSAIFFARFYVDIFYALSLLFAALFLSALCCLPCRLPLYTGIHTSNNVFFEDVTIDC